MIKKKLSSQSGLTVTELLIDLVLSTLVITAVLGLYVNYKQRYNYQEDTIFLFQNAEAAYNYIKDDIQVAGYYGCMSDPKSIEYTFTPSYDYQLNNKITAYEAINTGFNTTINTENLLSSWIPILQGQASKVKANPGSDIITIKYVDTVPLALTSTATTGGELEINNIENLVSVNDILLITDCIRTVMFKVGSLNTNTLVPVNSVGSLKAGAEIYRLNINTYYTKIVDGVPGLYKYSNSTEELLVPYVENMQLVFGQDLDGDNITNQFLTADALIDTVNNEIVNANFSFILRSINQHSSSQTSSNLKIFQAPSALQTTTIIPAKNDKYIRKSFDFEVNFPNTGGI